MNIPPFSKWVKNKRKGWVITFDPGETTGWSVWFDAELVKSGQIDTKTLPNTVKNVPQLMPFDESDRYVVIEEYRIYQWKTEQHAWSDVHTLRVIGCIETLMIQMKIPYHFQGAGIAKTFATDDKLKAWNLYKTGERHARDAIRHGCYFYSTP